MIKTIIIIMMLLIIPNVNALDNIIITEVLFNPLNTEAGGEAIELYNPTANYINISGYVIATESSSTDAVIQNAVIRPFGFYLIADSGWSTNKDNETWPNADYEETVTMSNSDSGIVLISNGTTVDAIGWGDPLSIDSGYEGFPHPDISEGLSLKRKITSNGFLDTDNNSNDFYASEPILRNSSHMQSFTDDSFYELNVTAVIMNSEVNILSSEIITDDYLDIEGIQINPLPGSSKEVNVRAVIEDYSNRVSEVFIIFESERFNLSYINSSDSNKTYGKVFEIEYYKPAKTYPLYLSVIDNSNNTNNKTLYFEYMPIVGFDIEGSSLSYDVVPGGSSISNIRIRNTGNVNLDVEIFGIDLTGPSVIDVENIIVSFIDEEEISFNLGKNPKNLNLNLNSGINSEIDLTFTINVPSNAIAGTYSGSISIIGTGY